MKRMEGRVNNDPTGVISKLYHLMKQPEHSGAKLQFQFNTHTYTCSHTHMSLALEKGNENTHVHISLV